MARTIAARSCKLVIQNIGTRALTQHIRDQGAQEGIISTGSEAILSGEGPRQWTAVTWCGYGESLHGETPTAFAASGKPAPLSWLTTTASIICQLHRGAAEWPVDAGRGGAGVRRTVFFLPMAPATRRRDLRLANQKNSSVNHLGSAGHQMLYRRVERKPSVRSSRRQQPSAIDYRTGDLTKPVLPSAHSLPDAPK